jgi:hypothetical protein
MELGTKQGRYIKKAFSCSSRHHACKAGSKQADDRVQLVHGRIWEQSIKQSLKRILSLFNELLVCYLHHTLSHQSTVIFPPINSQIPANNVFILEHKGGGEIRKCSPILQEPRGGDNKTERRANRGCLVSGMKSVTSDVLRDVRGYSDTNKKN